MIDYSNMHTLLVLLFFAIGLAFIIKGGDFFVDAASWIADVSGIPKFIVGATIVSVATTLPEMLVSVFASLQNSVDMAAGNAIGSVTANTAFIMALALIFMGGEMNRKDYIAKTIFMLAPTVIMFISCFNGLANSYFPIIACVLLLLIFAANLFENIFAAKKHAKLENPEDEEKVKPDKKTIIINILKFVFGAAGIVIGANFLVDTATVLAGRAGVSEQIIGLTIVAVGTSLPELVTTITAIVKKQHSLSVGNIIGANILDLTFILPVCGVIYGIKFGGLLPVSAQTVLLDIPFCFCAGLVALVPAFIKGKFSKWQGFVLIALYIAYIAIMAIGVDKIGIPV